MINVHFGCQQNIYCSDVTQESNDELMNFTRSMCDDAENTIRYTRFFGCGTFIIAVVMFIMYYDLAKNRLI